METLHLSLKMSTAQIDKMSVTKSSPYEDLSPNDHTRQTESKRKVFNTKTIFLATLGQICLNKT